MNADGFNEIIHSPIRLRSCALLTQVEKMQFAMLRDQLGVADSVLSKHLKVLVEAGYVALDKPTGKGGKMLTWAKLTPRGRRALAAHLAELRAMAEAAEAVDSGAAGPVGH